MKKLHCYSRKLPIVSKKSCIQKTCQETRRGPEIHGSCIGIIQGTLSAPKSQRFLRFAIAMPNADPEIARFRREEKAMLHCDLSVRWTVASDLRFRAAISEPKTSSFCGISGDLAPSTRKSLAIAIVRVLNRGGDLVCFFVIFSYLRDSEAFVICTRPAGPQS